METEVEQLKRENETLKRENAELREINSKLNKAIQQLFDTRQQLLDVQGRLTVTEQVTAATQRRQLIQEGLYENPPPDSVYEKLRFDPTQEHVYEKLQLTTHIGCIIFDLISCEECITLILHVTYLSELHLLEFYCLSVTFIRHSGCSFLLCIWNNIHGVPRNRDPTINMT